jgi:hypothetical protein
MMVPLAPLLVDNHDRLECVRRNESGNEVSALNRYKRMQSTPPAITLAADGLSILDGLHRVLVADSKGEKFIAAHRHTLT